MKKLMINGKPISEHLTFFFELFKKKLSETWEWIKEHKTGILITLGTMAGAALGAFALSSSLVSEEYESEENECFSSYANDYNASGTQDDMLCPSCYEFGKEYGTVELNTLERDEDGMLSCPVCGEEYTDTSLSEAWYCIRFDEKIEEESEIAQAQFEFQMMEEGLMNSNGEWIDEDGYPLYPEPWDPMD